MWIMIKIKTNPFFNEILVKFTYIVRMIADQNVYDIIFQFFYPAASAMAYGGRWKFVSVKHLATAEGENCADSPTLYHGCPFTPLPPTPTCLLCQSEARRKKCFLARIFFLDSSFPACCHEHAVRDECTKTNVYVQHTLHAIHPLWRGRHVSQKLMFRVEG